MTENLSCRRARSRHNDLGGSNLQHGLACDVYKTDFASGEKSVHSVLHFGACNELPEKYLNLRLLYSNNTIEIFLDQSGKRFWNGQLNTFFHGVGSPAI